MNSAMTAWTTPSGARPIVTTSLMIFSTSSSAMAEKTAADRSRPSCSNTERGLLRAGEQGGIHNEWRLALNHRSCPVV